jgi:ABC-type phosphate transport system substrate-binding protein
VKGAAGVLALLAVAVAGCGSGGGGNTTSTAKSRESVDVQLQEQNFSGEDGTATLTADGSKTKIVILMASFAAYPQPVHIHKGTCAKLDATPAYPLTNVVQGRSTTTVSVPLSTLLKGHYAINVHRSAKQLKTYVACGDITTHSAPAETVTTSE